MLQVGDCQVRRIVEWAGPAFTPEEFLLNFDTGILKRRPELATARLIDPASGMLVISLHSFVIRTRHHTVLIDTCAGNCKPRAGRLFGDMLQTNYLGKLSRLGLAPENIDYVFCTHLHWDHVGWNTQLLNGRWVPTFPNAKYVLAKSEFDHWETCLREGPASLHTKGMEDSILPLLETKQAVFVSEGFSVDDNLTIRSSPGHSPGHVVIDLQSNGQSVTFSGDAIHHPLQFADPHCSSIACWDPIQAGVTRQQLLEEHVESGKLLLPAHFPTPTACRVSHHNEAFSFEFADFDGRDWS